MIAASRRSTEQHRMTSFLITFVALFVQFCAARSATVIVSGGDQTSGSGQAYVVVGDNLASYSSQQQQQPQNPASFNGQTAYIRGQQYQVLSADDLYGSSNQGGASSNSQGVYVDDASAIGASDVRPATDVQLNEIPVQSVSLDLLPAGYQQLSATYGGALGSSASSSSSDTPAQSSQTNFAGLNLAALGIEPPSYLSGRGSSATISSLAASLSTSKPGATQSARLASGTAGRGHGSAKRSGGRRRVDEEDDEEQEQESEDEDQAAVGDDEPREADEDDGEGNLEDSNYEVATRVSNSEAKMGYRRRRKKIKPKVIIVKKVLPLSTTTYRG